MEKYLAVLSQCKLFQDIKADDLLAMLSCMKAQTACYARNETVFFEGNPAHQVGIVLSGRLQILRHAVCGNRSVIASFGPGQLFGEAFACAGVSTLPVSVIATQDSEILFIDCQRILNVCTNACPFHMQLITNLLRIIASRCIRFNQTLEVITQPTTREKLLTFLSIQAHEAGSSSFTIPYNRQQLADYLGVSRSAMTTELTRLKDDGWIRFEKNRFELLTMQNPSAD